MGTRSALLSPLRWRSPLVGLFLEARSFPERRRAARCRAFPAPARRDFTAFLRHPGPLPARAAVTLAAVNLAAVTFFLLSYSRHGVAYGPYRIDLDVYRIGGRVWLSGGNLYGRLPPTRAGVRLPFTYPPAAAVLLSPFSLVPMTVAVTVLTLVTIALLAVVLAVVLRHLGGPRGGPLWALAWLLPPALFLEPVRDTLAFGQVNVALMALVTLDCLTDIPRWPRGALVGLAAAVKLTPLAFVLFFLLRRDYRAGLTAALSFAAVTAAGFAVAWHDSVRYWTGTVFQTGRIGNPASPSNQCIQAALARAGLGPPTALGIAAWLALSAVAVVAACRGMRYAFAASQDCWALSLNAFATLLISPVSWSHHWVWCAPAVLTLAALSSRHRARLPLAAAGAGLLIFATAPQSWFPPGAAGREPQWAAWQQAIGSSYVLFAALMLLLSAGALLTPLTRPSVHEPRRSPGTGRRNRPPGSGGAAIHIGGYRTRASGVGSDALSRLSWSARSSPRRDGSGILTDLAIWPSGDKLFEKWPFMMRT